MLPRRPPPPLPLSLTRVHTQWLSIRFSSFNLECNFDFVRFYLGSSILNGVLESYSCNLSPFTVIIPGAAGRSSTPITFC